MKKNASFARGVWVSALASLFCACVALLTACSPKVVLRFNTLPGHVPVISSNGFENHVPEPAEPAGGFVYIQTGYAEGAEVYGPYPVAPGGSIETRDIPKGKYSRLALFYSPMPLPVREEKSAGDDSASGKKASKSKAVSVEGLPVTAANDGEFWEKTSSEPVAAGVFNEGGAAALFGDVRVRSIRKTVLGARLIPLASTVFSRQDSRFPPCVDLGGKVRKQFIKIDTTGSQSVYVMLSNYQGAGIVYAGTLALYGSDGSILGTKTFNKTIPEDLPESVLFPLPQSGAVWLYAEYISAGKTSLPIFFY